MKIILNKTSLRIIIAVLTVLSYAAAQDSAQSADARLRSLFFQRDFETGAIEGAKLVAANPNTPSLKAWYVLNLVRSGQEKQAIALAEEMTKRLPRNAWSWFALAGALNYAQERPADALSAGEKALKLLSTDPDVIWIRAQTLANDEKHRAGAIAFVDSQRSRVKNPADLLVAKGYAQYRQAWGPPRDEQQLATAFSTFEEARRIDPANISAWYLPSTLLNALRRGDEAYPLAKKAVALAPSSTDVHQAFWDAVTGSRETAADSKRQEVEADVITFLQAHGDRPGVLSAVAGVSRTMKWTDRQRDCEDKILAGFPESIEAEWIFASRWRDLGKTKEGAESAQYRQILREFIDRPRHHFESLLGEAYQHLFAVLNIDDTASPDELYRAAEGGVKYEKLNPHITYVIVPIALADRKIRLADAERIAREGIDALKKKIESQRSSYKSQGEYERAMGWATGMGHDALGWVLLAESRPAEAEKELLAAYDLNHEDRRTLDHLGRYYLSRNEISKAEEYFIKGLGVQGPGTNPCETSLRSLYHKNHGSLEGIDEYFEKLKVADRTKRRDRVLAGRIAAPKGVPAFSLKGLDGKRISLEGLKGKTVVINFWGIWCGWCVQELPEYQKLFEKYAKDPAVVILTIDNDAHPDDVPPWLAQKKYTFPVLIDDGYVSKAGIHSFPTTWFLDPEGRKIFEKVGWSEKLLEEFSWRIEAMRGSTPSGRPRSQGDGRN
jgi:thiol-disulfide isomerase/thioredoxin/Flp pilus assembly protein TadD